MKIDYQPFFLKKKDNKMTKTCAKREQGGAQRRDSFKTSKGHRYAAKSIDCYSFVFIAVHDKRLMDPSMLSPEISVCS